MEENKETKKCPHCQSEINIKATKCPHCQSNLLSFSKRPLGCGTASLIVFGIVFMAIIASVVSSTSNNNQSSNQYSSTPTDTSSTFLSSNSPTIKELSTVPADHVGQSFDLYVNAEAANYYNYGFDDETQWYSLTVWDNSVSGDYMGIYAYMPKNSANKVLMDQLINSSLILKIHAEIPKDKYQSSSNAFLQIDSWEVVH